MKTFFIIIVFTYSLFNISCNSINTLPLNIPFSFQITAQGNSNPSISSAYYCLSNSSTYQNYVEKIDKLTFIEAAWRIDSLKNIITGSVKLNVKVKNIVDNTIFQKTLPSTNPLNYKGKPYILPLTDSEIQVLNNYFNNYHKDPSKCLEASIEITVTNGTAPYYLKGNLDMVVEAKTKL